MLLEVTLVIVNRHDGHPSSGRFARYEPPALTLDALLEEPLLQGATVLQGRPADVSVAWTLPYSEVSLLQNNLAGVLIHVNPAMMDAVSADVLEGMRDREAAAVVFTSRPAEALEDPSLPSVPVPAGLPVLWIPASVTYWQLSVLVAQKVLAQSTHVLEYGVRVHAALSELLYRGAGLAAMTRQMSRLSGCPVFLLDTHLRVLAYESVSPLPVPDPSEVVRLLGEAIHAGELPPSETGLPSAGYVECRLESGLVGCVPCPIVLGGTTYGWLAIVEMVYPPQRHDLAQHLVIAEHGAAVTGSEMLRLRSVAEAEERARGDFVHALLHGRFQNASELNARATHHEFDPLGAHIVIVIHGTVSGSQSADLERQAAVARWIRDASWPGNSRTFTTTVGDLVVVVRELRPQQRGPHGRAVDDIAGQYLGELDRDLRARVGSQVRLAYGRPAVGAAGVKDSYREARLTLGVAAKLHLSRVCGYSQLRVLATLSALAETARGREFAAEVLAPLQRDDEASRDLEHVVMTYVHNGGNLSSTARDLQMHRNTVLYKISRAARLLAMDLRTPESQFTLWLAHRLELLAQIDQSLNEEMGFS